MPVVVMVIIVLTIGTVLILGAEAADTYLKRKSARELAERELEDLTSKWAARVKEDAAAKEKLDNFEEPKELIPTVKEDFSKAYDELYPTAPVPKKKRASKVTARKKVVKKKTIKGSSKNEKSRKD